MYDIITKAKCLVDYQHFTKTLRGVSKNQGVPKSTIQRWVSKDAKCLEVREERKKRRTPSQTKNDVLRFIGTMLETNPFITMNDLAASLHEQHKIQFTGRTIQRYVSEMDYTYKKAVNVIDHKFVHSVRASKKRIETIICTRLTRLVFTWVTIRGRGVRNVESALR